MMLARPSWAGRMVVLMLVWAVPGTIAVGQLAVHGLTYGSDFELLKAMFVYMPAWELWALATPLVVTAGRRLPLTRRRWWMHLPVHLALNAIIALAFVSMQYACGREAGFQPFVDYAAAELVPQLAIKSAVVQSMLYWGVIAADRGLAYQRRLRAAEVERAQLEARLVEAQLDALRGQLRPHFLFNTLNAITVLVRRGDGAAAVRMLGGLSELLRRSLSSLTVERTSLRAELEFLEHYLEIQRVRFPDRLTVTIDADPAALDAQVPSLLLQPLVENAIEHGVGPRASGGAIRVRAHVDGDRLRMEVHDDGVGLAAGHREGIGLGHVRRRLAQRYPDRHRFAIEPADPGTVVRIELPLEAVRAGSG